MKAIERNEQGRLTVVQLTDAEKAASRFFDLLLDRGLGIKAAVSQVRIFHPGLDEEFYEGWLGQ